MANLTAVAPVAALPKKMSPGVRKILSSCGSVAVPGLEGHDATHVCFPAAATILPLIDEALPNPWSLRGLSHSFGIVASFHLSHSILQKKPEARYNVHPVNVQSLMCGAQMKWEAFPPILQGNEASVQAGHACKDTYAATPSGR